jgi:hypothetical protein
LIVDSPPAHIASQTSAPPSAAHHPTLHGSRSLAGGYIQQQQQQLKTASFASAASAPLHSASTAPEASLNAGLDGYLGCESIAATSDAAVDPTPPPCPAAFFWNISTLSPPSPTSVVEVVTSLRVRLASHLQLSAVVPFYITGCVGSGSESEFSTVATTVLLDCSTSSEASQRLATELLLWCCQNPRSYVVVACSSSEVLRVCRRLALCGNRVVLAYSGISSSVGVLNSIEWSALCSGLADLPPPPNYSYPSSSSSNDDMAVIRFIHSILIDAPVSGLTITELCAAYAHHRSLSSSSSAPPPLEKNPLSFNNFLELLLCNSDYFVTQWNTIDGGTFQSHLCGILFDFVRRRIQSSSWSRCFSKLSF